MTHVHGRCLCGALTFTAALPTLWVAHCHCTLCQKNAGAAFVTWAGFSDADVTIGDDADALRWYSATENAYRGFCENCGSTMFFKSARWPGELHITVVNFTEALDREPQVHVNWETHQPWLHFDDGLPRQPALFLCHRAYPGTQRAQVPQAPRAPLRGRWFQGPGAAARDCAR
jgi:hypothetical protein